MHPQFPDYTKVNEGADFLEGRKVHESIWVARVMGFVYQRGYILSSALVLQQADAVLEALRRVAGKLPGRKGHGGAD